MANVEHKDITGANMHPPYNWSFTNATTRAAAGTFVSGDIGKWAYQQSDSTIWQLASFDGGGVPTWTQVAAGGGTVTSVGLTVPPDKSVSGSPVTGAGALAESSVEATIIRCMCGDPSQHEGAVCPQGKEIRLGTISYWHRSPVRRLAFAISKRMNNKIRRTT